MSDSTYCTHCGHEPAHEPHSIDCKPPPSGTDDGPYCSRCGWGVTGYKVAVRNPTTCAACAEEDR